jgi:Glycosyl transferase family 2
VKETANAAVRSHDGDSPDAGLKTQQPYGWLLPSAFWIPGWNFSLRIAHLPFYFWLIDATRPRLIVDLVPGRPDDYLAFCQAVEQLNYGAECFGVKDIFDKRDPESDVDSLSAYHNAHFDSISHLHDEPAQIFDALGSRTIDLIHIDGRYALKLSDVQRQQWLARLSPRGLVIIVHPEHLPPSWRKTLKKRPSFTLNGKPNVELIAATGTYPPQLSPAFKNADSLIAATMRSAFEHFGSTLRERASHRDTASFASRTEISLAHQSAAIDLLRAEKTELEEKIQRYPLDNIRNEARIATLEQYVEQFRAEVLRLQEYAIKTQTEIERVHHVVGDRDREIERLERLIDDRDKEIRRLGIYSQRIKSDNLKRISALDDKIQEGEDDIQRLSTLAGQRENEIARLSQTIVDGVREIARLNQVVVDGEKEIARLNQVIVDGARENVRLNKLVIDGEDKSTRAVNQLVHEHETEVARLNQVIVEGQREADRLNKLIVDRENESARAIDQLIHERQSQVAQLIDIIDDRREELRSTNERANLQREQAASREAELSVEILQSAGQINDLQVRVVDLEITLNLITQSTAWKVTRPFRRFFAHFPGTARFLRRAIKLLWWTLSLQLISRLKQIRHSRQRLSQPIVFAAGPVLDEPSPPSSFEATSGSQSDGTGQKSRPAAIESDARSNRHPQNAAAAPKAIAPVFDGLPGVLTPPGASLLQSSGETPPPPGSKSNIEDPSEELPNPHQAEAASGSEVVTPVLDRLPRVLTAQDGSLLQSASETRKLPSPASKSQHSEATLKQNREENAFESAFDRLPCGCHTDSELQSTSETAGPPSSSISIEDVLARVHDFEGRIHELASSVSSLGTPAQPVQIVDRAPEVHQLGMNLQRESARIQIVESRLSQLSSVVELERHRTDYALLGVHGMLKEIELYHKARAQADYNRVFEQTTPLVSICVSTMNRSDILIERCLSSLVNQSYRNIQIIVVGDHCTDDTGSRVAQLRDDRISFHNLSSRGPYPPPGMDRWMVAGTNAINAAMTMCEGQFVTHLDDDDAATIDRIETMVNAAQQHKADFCWHPFWCENKDGSWYRLGDGRLELGLITTGSIFYHHYFRKFPWDIFAYRIREPGDWNRLRKIRSLRPKLHFVDRPLMFHYSEGSQRPFTRRDGEFFVE